MDGRCEDHRPDDVRSDGEESEWRRGGQASDAAGDYRRDRAARRGDSEHPRSDSGAGMRTGWHDHALADVLQETETINPHATPQNEFHYIDVSSVSNTTLQIV